MIALKKKKTPLENLGHLLTFLKPLFAQKESLKLRWTVNTVKYHGSLKMGNYVHVPSAEVCFYASQRDCLHSFLTLPLFRLNFLLSSSCCWNSSGKSGCLSRSSPPSSRPKIQCPSDMPTVNTSCKLALSRALAFWGPDVTDMASWPPQCSMSSLPLLGKRIPNLIGESSQTEK